MSKQVNKKIKGTIIIVASFTLFFLNYFLMKEGIVYPKVGGFLGVGFVLFGFYGMWTYTGAYRDND